MADNSQVADALRTIAEAADDSIAADDIETVADAIDGPSVPDAFYYAPSAGDYGHPTTSSIYIEDDDHEDLSYGIIVPADEVNGEPDRWSWGLYEEGEERHGSYTYEVVAEVWGQAHE